MRRTPTALAAPRAAVLAAALLLPALAAGAAGGKPRIAVWDVKIVQGTQGLQPSTAEVLTDVVATDLAQTGQVQVIARQDVLAVLGFEKHKAQLGCMEQGCLAEIGGALGADYVVSGQVGRLGDQFRVSLIAVDARSALAVARAAEFCPAEEGALATASRVALKALFEQLAGALPKATQAASGVKPVAERAADAKRLYQEGKFRESAQAYDDVLARDPNAVDRCASIARGAQAWEQAGEKAEAASRYRAVGTEPGCAGQNPNAAARALDRAASLFDGIGRKEDALAAWKVLAGLKVSDPAAQSRVLQARMRLGLDSEGK
jgi:TolB-like protein